MAVPWKNLKEIIDDWEHHNTFDDKGRVMPYQKQLTPAGWLDNNKPRVHRSDQIDFPKKFHLLY